MQRREFTPIPVSIIDVDAAWSQPKINEQGEAMILACRGARPIGSILATELSAQNARERVLKDVANFTERRLTGHPGEDATPMLSATAVICTLGENPNLESAVRAVLSQDHPAFECVVVDNRPASGKVRKRLASVAGDPRLRIVTEPRQGLSRARNRALDVATGLIIAFTDDDAVPQPNWLSRLSAVLERNPEVDCATGLVFPASLDTREELWFEEYGSFDKGYERVVWALPGHRALDGRIGLAGSGGPVFPFSVGSFGSGNNMAFRRAVLLDRGGFDLALGAGTAAAGGEDLDAFVTLILAGGAIVYEPSAIVRHHHRSGYGALRRQVFSYGVGLSALITKQFLAHPRTAFSILRRTPAGVVRLLDPHSAKNAGKSTEFPRELTLLEILGVLCGPSLYLVSWLRVTGRPRVRRATTRATRSGRDLLRRR